jgi:hypothetical protein
MTDPITPPPELVQQWYNAIDDSSTSWNRQLIIRAAQWGADQELEACCEWIKSELRGQLRPAHRIAIELRDARRPKPPSLKEQALEVFEALIHGDASGLDVGVIRRALEALPE